jgi:c-di-GMP-binding flagellar brake protein YcgR
MDVGVQTRISDISESGALLVTFMEGVPVEARIKMSFVMPGACELFVSVEGIVRHTGALDKDLFRSGVEFLKMKKKDQLAIREYVAAHKKK